MTWFAGMLGFNAYVSIVFLCFFIYLIEFNSILFYFSKFRSPPHRTQQPRSTFASSAPSGIATNLIEQFNLSNELAALTISLFVFGYCVGPLFWGPLSEYVRMTNRRMLELRKTDYKKYHV